MSSPDTLALEKANDLVLEFRGWAESIARSVARSWNLDWQQDGLDGAAMEALIFCARRFDVARGVPFKGYARKRIHEAASEAARKSKGWLKRTQVPDSSARTEQRVAQVSSELLTIFPELRSGEMPTFDDNYDSGGNSDDLRGSIRSLLVGATLVASKHNDEYDDPDDMIDLKRIVRYIAELDPVHQILLWRIYWDGISMRNLAAEWEIDELNIIREHKALVIFLHKCISRGKEAVRPKVRPGLKDKAARIRKETDEGPFARMIREGQE